MSSSPISRVLLKNSEVLPVMYVRLNRMTLSKADSISAVIQQVYYISAHIQRCKLPLFTTRLLLIIVSKVGPAGVGPATKRIQALFQFGYNFVSLK